MLYRVPCVCDGWKYSSSRALHPIFDSLLITLSLIVNGRLSTLLYCSAHLIASLSVRSVLPSVLSSGVVPELFDHKQFSCKRLIFIYVLAQPGVLHVPEPVLDCLTNIAVGRLLECRASIILMYLVQAVFVFKKPLNFFIILDNSVMFWI